MLKHAWGPLPNSMVHDMYLVQDRGDAAPWEHEKSSTFSAGQRVVLSFGTNSPVTDLLILGQKPAVGNTYAAAFTDVRGWALRKLLKRRQSF